MKTADWRNTTYIVAPLVFICLYSGWSMTLVWGSIGLCYTIFTFVVSIFYLFFVYFDPMIIDRNLKVIVYLLICFTLFGSNWFISHFAPKGSYLFKEGSYEMVTRSTIIQPFSIERPLETKPPESGKFKVLNEHPEWAISVYYEMDPGTRVRDDLFWEYKKAFSEGITLPSSLFSDEERTKIAISEYLEKKFPYLHILTEVALVQKIGEI